MCKTPGSRIGSENEFCDMEGAGGVCVTRDVYYIRSLDFSQRKGPRSSFPGATCVRVHRHTHTYVCSCSHCCEGYDAGALYCVVGVCVERERPEGGFAQPGRGV